MSLIQAYLFRYPSMKPLTKIRVFRLRLAAVVLSIYWAGMFLGTHLSGVSVPRLSVSDKIEHFSAFFGLTLLLCYVSTSRGVWRRLAVIAGIVIVYAAIDEWTQRFVRRTPDLLDFAADLFGMLTAMTVYLVARWLLTPWIERNRVQQPAETSPGPKTKTEPVAATLPPT
ncbi:MAG: VanZ family protein [Planctomycetota bacterium]